MELYNTWTVASGLFHSASYLEVYPCCSMCNIPLNECTAFHLSFHQLIVQQLKLKLQIMCILRKTLAVGAGLVPITKITLSPTPSPDNHGQWTSVLNTHTHVRHTHTWPNDTSERLLGVLSCSWLWSPPVTVPGKKVAALYTLCWKSAR